MNNKDFIVGEKFIEFCEYKFFPPNKKDFNPFKTHLPPEDKKGIFVVYTHIHLVPRFFSIIKNYKGKFILVTHNSDHSLTKEIFNNKPSNIIKWLSQNVEVDHPDIISLPIGLENSRWWRKIDKKNKMINKLKEEKNYTNLLYINHNIRTNPAERNAPYTLFNNKKWVTLQRGSNGQTFDGYLNNLYRHKFILCPAGNGVDTHRLWETLYMKSIPIVKDHVNTNFYKDLPILIVKTWKEINEEFLHQKFNEIKGNIYNIEKLKQTYWNVFITEISNTIHSYT